MKKFTLISDMTSAIITSPRSLIKLTTYRLTQLRNLIICAAVVLCLYVRHDYVWIPCMPLCWHPGYALLACRPTQFFSISSELSSTWNFSEPVCILKTFLLPYSLMWWSISTLLQLGVCQVSSQLGSKHSWLAWAVCQSSRLIQAIIIHTLQQLITPDDVVLDNILS